MTVFTGTAGADTADAINGILIGFTGGTLADLTDNIGDEFIGGDGNDVVIVNNNQANILRGGAGDDQLRGSGGSDVLDAGAGADTLDGGGGRDTALYLGGRLPNTLGGPISLTEQFPGGVAGGDVLTNIEDLTGGDQYLSLYGSDVSNTIRSGSGSDALYGRSGNDFLFGGDNADYLVGGEGADELNGEAGIDTAGYEGSTVGVTVYLSLAGGSGFRGDAEGDVLRGVENVNGTAFDDVLFSSGDLISVLMAGDGDDVLYGDGADFIAGGAGSDVLFGGLGGALNLNLGVFSIETVWGSVVGDTFNGTEATTSLTMIGAGGADTMTGGSAADFFYFDDLDTIAGGDGSDWAVATLSGSGVTLNMVAASIENAWGSTSNDTISATGSLSAVVIVGDQGDDVITGGYAGDFLYGLDGADRLKGGAGDDHLIGGAGADVFVYDSNPANWNVDTIWDFNRGEDKISIKEFGFTFGQFPIDSVNGHSVINLAPTWQIWVLNTATLDASDFIFN